jgi:hypothetical protein
MHGKTTGSALLLTAGAITLVVVFLQTGRDVERVDRDEILAPGNMENARVLLENFLGKETDSRAFYQRLGITPTAGT